jgi:hypothetical protein
MMLILLLPPPQCPPPPSLLRPARRLGHLLHRLSSPRVAGYQSRLSYLVRRLNKARAVQRSRLWLDSFVDSHKADLLRQQPPWDLVPRQEPFMNIARDVIVCQAEDGVRHSGVFTVSLRLFPPRRKDKRPKTRPET